MRLLTVSLLAFFAAAWAGAEPITYTFSGTATGTAGLTQFTDAQFLFTFTSDTNDIVQPSCCDTDYSTPGATTATVYIEGVGTADLADTQAIFVNQSVNEENIGIWHYNEPDWLDLVTPAATTYNLTTSLGPVTGTGFSSVEMGGHYLQSYLGNLAFDSVSGVTFQATLGTSPDPTPEPASLALMGTGIAGLLLVKARRAFAR